MSARPLTIPYDPVATTVPPVVPAAASAAVVTLPEVLGVTATLRVGLE